MAIRRRAESGPVPVYCGFRDDGSSFAAKEPVDNACTRAMRYLVDLQRKANLRPDEMVLEISRQPEFVQSMFGNQLLTQWSVFDQYWQWALCWTGTSAASTLKYRAAGVPTFGYDEEGWKARCAHAARIHSEPPIPEGRLRLDEFVADLSAEKSLSEEDVKTEVARQLTALKKAGVALIELKRISPPIGSLVWLAIPKLLRRSGK